MTIRWLATSMAVGCLIGNLVADESRTQETLRAKSDSQFDKLDTDDNDELDEKELRNLTDADRETLRSRGLPDTYPVSRAAFVDSSTAATSTVEKLAEEESAARKSADGVKSDGKKLEPAAPAVVAHSRNPAKRGRYVPELPSEFNDRDKNGDGQIALYEWDRKKYAEFTKLDKNGDGFLTPAELLPKEVLRALYSKSPVLARNAGAPGRSAPGSSGGESDAIDKEARKTFADLDQNKDGSLDESDWGKSRRTRASFESAGVTVSLPINVEAFVPLFRRVNELPSR